MCGPPAYLTLPAGTLLWIDSRRRVSQCYREFVRPAPDPLPINLMRSSKIDRNPIAALYGAPPHNLGLTWHNNGQRTMNTSCNPYLACSTFGLYWYQLCTNHALISLARIALSLFTLVPHFLAPPPHLHHSTESGSPTLCLFPSLPSCGT
jgi:hypothetical protein